MNHKMVWSFLCRLLYCLFRRECGNNSLRLSGFCHPSEIWAILRNFGDRNNNKTILCVLSCFSCVQAVQPCGLQPTRLLCPWGFPGKNTGVGCHALLQGSSRPRDRRTCVSCIGRQVLYHWHHLGSPYLRVTNR